MGICQSITEGYNIPMTTNVNADIDFGKYKTKNITQYCNITQAAHSLHESQLLLLLSQ